MATVLAEPQLEKRACGFVASLLFVLILLACSVPGLAFADVKNSDMVMGQSVEARGLSSAQCPNLEATYAYMIDDEGTVYFARDAQKQVKIASVTKIMTALVALEYGDPTNTTITVSKEAADIGESSASLEAGDSMNLEVALKCMMVNSGNDAAEAIAESMGPAVRDALKEKLEGEQAEEVPEQGYKAFIYAMNLKAAELGMDESAFNNPHGLDMEQYEGNMHSSARDVALMAKAAMENELFRNIVKIQKETVSVTRGGAKAEVQLQSTDLLLGNYDGACGVKTGYTGQAGWCFCGAAEINGHTYFAVALNSKDDGSRFNDARALFNWKKDNTINYALAHSEETVSCALDGENTREVPVVADVSHKGWIDKTFKATLAEPDATVEIFALNGNVSQQVQYDDVSGNVAVGQKVGTITFKQHNKEIATMDLVAAEDCAGPNFIEGIQVWWERLWLSFGGQPIEAENLLVNTTPLVGQAA